MINTKRCNPANYQSASRTSIGYLVIHYTGNEGNAAAATLRISHGSALAYPRITLWMKALCGSL